MTDNEPSDGSEAEEIPTIGTASTTDRVNARAGGTESFDTLVEVMEREEV